jgi:neutral amino acid transport system ATP-binding protein
MFILLKLSHKDRIISFIRIARKGLIRTFQIPRSPNKMTVLENMILASQRQSGKRISNVFVRWRDVRKEERMRPDHIVRRGVGYVPHYHDCGTERQEGTRHK